jgi:CheY-like chemotaxis protein
MDHMMPEMDGIEATRIIREETGTAYARNIPIIALTANAIIGNEKMFLEKGFQAFISKPIDVMQLDAVIRQWVRNRKAEMKYPEQDIKEPEPADIPDIAAESPEIEGIDTGKCMARFGGDRQTFLQVLRSYAVNTASLLDQIREVARDRLPEYAIVVHGIKGSSRGICAESLGNMAEELEHAAKAGNMEFVETHNSGFVESTEKLLDTLRTALDSIDTENPKPRKDVPDAALLGKLAEYCENYDMDGIDGVMKELDAFDYETQADLVAWLREHVERMELAEIRNRLSTAAA